jgi:hypothetical protein
MQNGTKPAIKHLAVVLIVIALSTPALIAEERALRASLSNDTSDRSIDAGSAQTQEDQPQNQKDKSKKEKGKKKHEGGDDDTGGLVEFSDAVAQSVLQQLMDGLEGHSDRRMLSAFDDSKMDGYLNFQNQIVALFQRFEAFHVHFRIYQATGEGNRGEVVVDFELEEVPRSADAQPVRKRDQLQFDMERGKKGWKIVDLRPRSFFS